jgi:sensor histidine kinase YesM
MRMIASFIFSLIGLVALISLLVRWLFIEVALLPVTKEKAEYYESFRDRLSESLKEKNDQLFALKEENKHLKEEITKIKEITNQWN